MNIEYYRGVFFNPGSWWRVAPVVGGSDFSCRSNTRAYAQPVPMHLIGRPALGRLAYQRD